MNRRGRDRPIDSCCGGTVHLPNRLVHHRLWQSPQQAIAVVRVLETRVKSAITLSPATAAAAGDDDDAQRDRRLAEVRSLIEHLQACM